MPQKCGSNQAQKHLEQTHPEYFHNRKALEQQIQEYIAANPNEGGRAVVTLPVVFHIIHSGQAIGTGANITDQRVLSQMTILNEDFRRLNADAVFTHANFLSAAADCEINFCLATVDPQGNPTTGINRVVNGIVQFNGIGQVDAMAKPGNQWDPTKYINIWTVEFSAAANLLGFAYFPPAPAALDGLVIDHRTVGRPPDNPNFGFSGGAFNLGRTATHEMGHYLNLLHLDGMGGDCGLATACNVTADFCCDTPPEMFLRFGCPDPNISQSCGNQDMVQNFMEFVDDACMNLFTQDQKARMQATLNRPRSGLLNSNVINCANNYWVTNLMPMTATLNWTPVPGAISYNVRWKAIGAPAWIATVNVAVPANFFNVAGLAPAGAWHWEVQPVMGTGPGAWSPGQLFRTPMLNPPPCPYDPNEYAIFGPYLIPGGQGTAIICPNADMDRFVIMDAMPMLSNFNLVLTQLGADYDFELRDAASGVVLANSTNVGLVNDVINYTTIAPGMAYQVYVYSKLGAFVNQPYVVQFNQTPIGPKYIQQPEDFLGEAIPINIYPNPADQEIIVEVELLADTQTRVQIVDMLGRTWMENTSDVVAGHDRVRLSTTELPNGLYIVQVEANGQKQIQRLVVDHQFGTNPAR